MTAPPNTQPAASQIAREIRAELQSDWPLPNHMHKGLAVLLDAFDAQAREIAELREALSVESEACALVAEGFPGSVNSKMNKPFVEAGVMHLVNDRDLAIGSAIRARKEG